MEKTTLATAQAAKLTLLVGGVPTYSLVLTRNGYYPRRASLTWKEWLTQESEAEVRRIERIQKRSFTYTLEPLDEIPSVIGKP